MDNLWKKNIGAEHRKKNRDGQHGHQNDSEQGIFNNVNQDASIGRFFNRISIGHALTLKLNSQVQSLKIVYVFFVANTSNPNKNRVGNELFEDMIGGYYNLCAIGMAKFKMDTSAIS